jgi:beta/gamma crystallin
MSHVILFEHANFHGAHKHVVGAEANLNAQDDNFFNDKVSSLAVLEGTWAFYRNAGFVGQYAKVLGVGLYPFVGNVDIQNDDMSSLQPVSGPSTTVGDPIEGHVILFEHANFHGAHKHVFRAEPNLNAGDDSFFNDKVSSLAVLGGTWAFFRNANFNGQYAQSLGPGLYSFVGNVDIQNDDMSSLRPTR